MSMGLKTIGMATFLAMLLFSCKEKDLQEEKNDEQDSDTSLTERIVKPIVVDYAPGYSQFIEQRFSGYDSKEDILRQCTRILSLDSGDVTLGGFGGYIVIDLGNEARPKDYTFRFDGNGFDDNFCLVSVSNDAVTWRHINTSEDVPTVEFSYVQNTEHSKYSWKIDSLTTCRQIGVREICNTQIRYDWDTTPIWSKIIDGVETGIPSHSESVPLLYIRTHKGPYFNSYLSKPSGVLPKMDHALCDSFVVGRDVRYLKFQNVFDSISPIVGEISPEIKNIMVLFR